MTVDYTAEVKAAEAVLARAVAEQVILYEAHNDIGRAFNNLGWHWNDFCQDTQEELEAIHRDLGAVLSKLGGLCSELKREEEEARRKRNDLVGQAFRANAPPVYPATPETLIAAE